MSLRSVANSMMVMAAAASMARRDTYVIRPVPEGEEYADPFEWARRRPLPPLAEQRARYGAPTRSMDIGPRQKSARRRAKARKARAKLERHLYLTDYPAFCRLRDEKLRKHRAAQSPTTPTPEAQR